jgi:hypothetical protein
MSKLTSKTKSFLVSFFTSLIAAWVLAVPAANANDPDTAYSMHGIADANGNVKNMYVLIEGKKLFQYMTTGQKKILKLDKEFLKGEPKGRLGRQVLVSESEVAVLLGYEHGVALKGNESKTWSYTQSGYVERPVFFAFTSVTPADKKNLYLLAGWIGNNYPLMCTYDGTWSPCGPRGGKTGELIAGISATLPIDEYGLPKEILMAGTWYGDFGRAVLFHNKDNVWKKFYASVEDEVYLPGGFREIWSTADNTGKIRDVFAAYGHGIRSGRDAHALFRCEQEAGVCNYNKWELQIGCKGKNCPLHTLSITKMWGTYDTDGKTTRLYAVGSDLANRSDPESRSPAIFVLEQGKWRKFSAAELPFQRGTLENVWGTVAINGQVHLFVIGYDYTSRKPCAYEFFNGIWTAITMEE